jgi:tRNA 2-selenouridine synthase
MIDAVKSAGATEGDEVLVYCWRGGMRSGSTGWLLSLCGFKVSTLEGGYRSYRRWCRAAIGEDGVPPPTRVVVLGGCTGSGKTEVLHVLRAKGEQVLDLEGLANHRGSAFGAVGQLPQPSNET